MMAPARSLAFADGPPPEVAILDVGRPGTSGYDLARAIRKLPTAPAT